MPSGPGSTAGGASGAGTPIVISTGGAGGGAPAGLGGKRIFTVSYGHDWGTHNYL